jgi:hypothetical protein
MELIDMRLVAASAVGGAAFLLAPILSRAAKARWSKTKKEKA